jgi:hypothetical protein
MRKVLALKAERQKRPVDDVANAVPAADQGQHDERAPELVPDPVEMAPPAAVGPAVQAQKPNEPGAPQVVGPVVGNDPDPAPLAVLRPAPARVEHGPWLAILENYKYDFDYRPRIRTSEQVRSGRPEVSPRTGSSDLVRRSGRVVWPTGNRASNAAVAANVPGKLSWGRRGFAWLRTTAVLPDT